MEIKAPETGARTGAAKCLSSPHDLSTNPLELPLGCQTYPVRALIEQDFEATLKVLADAGFQEIELCSPVGYAGCGFAGLAKYSGTNLQKIFAGLGLKCESSHFSMQELRDDLAGRIAWAKELSLTQVIVPTLAGPPYPTMDDVKRVAGEFNKMAGQMANAGIQLGLHNEDFELTLVDGQRTYDLLFELLDPSLVKFQFQISTISRGYDAAGYFTKYPGRFMSMHLQDWSATEEKTVAAGQGDLDWKKIFIAAKAGGIKNYFVELSLDAMKASVPYLRALQV
ncbi:MAG TPA: sugar phosphate isomerase/epimerase [Bryobacteraceae bacterium]|jgi:sugar phosphate isomerase/epimerase|nr:sugar phosphate isomerase/epimerase [Bryobacteraceae bacterium]